MSAGKRFDPAVFLAAAAEGRVTSFIVRHAQNQ